MTAVGAKSSQRQSSLTLKIDAQLEHVAGTRAELFLNYSLSNEKAALATITVLESAFYASVICQTSME
ncbi:hypothetical protein Nepgr_007778 [Nepenthes gracilis]|uniref:Uncharacterized protein n=1 Tax=Nepenthes gracilis TaxID=150966 RepID=A0AAD3XIL8_NEPGR|nr:hypothetical protein Nepgr_007778 [Nepenthes gracilis]